MPMKYDALNLQVSGFERIDDLYHYLKFAYPEPKLQYRLIPTSPPYLEEEIYDLASDRYLGLWLDDCFDFAGADDEVVGKLEALFGHYLK